MFGAMDPHGPLLLEVWREASRHLKLEAFARTVAGLLARQLPLAVLGIVRYDKSAGTLELRATAGGASPGRPTTASRALRAPERRTLERWLRAGTLAVEGDEEGVRPLLDFFPDHRGGAWVGPLVSEQGVAGALVVCPAEGEVFTSGHRPPVMALLEPLSVALENDTRLHELHALREAAEADKRSALSRLGREELVDAVVGADGGLAPVLERVNLVARSDIPVLILGETGSGKEVVARAIHDRSTRAHGPFIRVNCGAIPPELIDSELFGHERGAFTGAGAMRRGWFERADEGTLFLDEIGDMPPAAQVRLLRVLQEGTFERVGGEQPIRVHVRVVAATHRDLPGLVQAGKFRDDLWYRIAGFPIVLPPLRERKQDIADLADHFARRAAKRFGLRAQPVGEADLSRLAAYDWPGNVRELATVMDRAALLGEGERLDVAAALGFPLARDPEPPVPPSTPPGSTQPSRTVGTLANAMRVHIEAALSATRGRIEGPRGAAALLDVNPHTLRARMRKLGVDWSRFRD
ncbi:MAG: sigma-54 interaction domain-containing protein [Gemmatimonadales bacterium]